MRCTAFIEGRRHVPVLIEQPDALALLGAERQRLEHFPGGPRSCG